MSITKIEGKQVEPFDYDTYWLESCKRNVEVITSQGVKVRSLVKIALMVKNEEGKIVQGEKIVGVLDYGGQVAGSILDWHLNGSYSLDYPTSLDLYLVKSVGE